MRPSCQWMKSSQVSCRSEASGDISPKRCLAHDFRFWKRRGVPRDIFLLGAWTLGPAETRRWELGMVRTARPRRCDLRDVTALLGADPTYSEDWRNPFWRNVLVAYGDEGILGACVATGLSEGTKSPICVPTIVTASGVRPSDVMESLLLSVTDAAGHRPVTVPVESGDDSCVIACLSVGFRPQQQDKLASTNINMLFA